MTIDEAIKILTDSIVGVEAFDDPELPDAIKLGIEALKEVARARRLGPPFERFRLPGETEVL